VSHKEPVAAALPDGREVHVIREDPLGDWIARLDGAEGRVARGRWLLLVLAELLGLPPGRKPQWVYDAIREVMGRDTPVGWRYPCACCDCFTLKEPPTGTFAICPVCRWEDDNLQVQDIDMSGGANTVSLRDARENFRRFGASEPRRRERVRSPQPYELP
jgi:hypothetical protein